MPRRSILKSTSSYEHSPNLSVHSVQIDKIKTPPIEKRYTNGITSKAFKVLAQNFWVMPVIDIVSFRLKGITACSTDKPIPSTK